ncbi:MAG: PilW family protein [Methylococcales bacterium]
MTSQIKNCPLCGSQNGLTMIELMIAMLLGLVLMGGVVQIFVGTKQSYNLQEAQSRLQENGRLAMHFLPHDIRLADFQGCRSRQQYTINPIIANPNVPSPSPPPVIDPLDPKSIWNQNGGIRGFNNVVAGTPDPVTGLPVVARGATVASLSIIAGTDIINLQFAGSCAGHLVENMTANNANIQIDANNTCGLSADRPNLTPNWPYFISDCVDTDIFRAGVDPVLPPGWVTHAIADNNSSGSLKKAYGTDAEIFSLQSITYFIAQNTIGNTSSLYRRDNATGTSEEVVEGVEDMQILYGEDINGDNTANYYVSAANVVAMQNVVSVKVTLLTRSLSDVNVTSQPVTYTYNGGLPTTAADRQLRKVFTSTVTLRNRLP